MNAAPRSCHLTESGRFALSHYLTLGGLVKSAPETQRLHKIVLFSKTARDLPPLTPAGSKYGRERDWALHPEKDQSKSRIKNQHSLIFLLFIVHILAEILLFVYHNIVILSKKQAEIFEIFHKFPYFIFMDCTFLLFIACGTDFAVYCRGHPDDFCKRAGKIAGGMESDALRDIDDLLIGKHKPALRLSDPAALQILNR